MLGLSETPDTLSASILSALCLYQLAGDNQHDLTQAYRSVYPLKQRASFKKNLTYGIADILQNIFKTRLFLAFVNHQWSASVVLHIP